MLLVLTEPDDVHADQLIQKVGERGGAVARFNPGDYPARAQISVNYAACGITRAELRTPAQRIPFDSVRAVWWRRPRAPRAHEDVVDPRTREYLEQEARAFSHDAWRLLDCRWLPARPDVVHNAAQKISQLQTAAGLGFELPPTLVSNSPEDVLEFYREHGGQIVSKLVSGVFFQSLGTTFSRYTEMVSTRDIGYVQAVRYGPTIFQAYVDKALELRITVVGERVFSAEIHSQASHHTRYDWRRYDHFTTVYRPHELPDDVRLRCVRLVRQFGLRYGAIDLILTPDGRYVFLEVNPNGQYLWIEEAAGLPISDAIVDELLCGGVA